LLDGLRFSRFVSAHDLWIEERKEMSSGLVIGREGQAAVLPPRVGDASTSRHANVLRWSPFAKRDQGKRAERFAAARPRVIATKVLQPMGARPDTSEASRKHIHHAIDDSLRPAAGTGLRRSYQIHRFDYHTPMQEKRKAARSPGRYRASRPRRSYGAFQACTYQFDKMLAAQRPARTGALRHPCKISTTWCYGTRRARNAAVVREKASASFPEPLARGFLTGNRQHAGFRRRKPGDDRTDDYARRCLYSAIRFAVETASPRSPAPRGFPNAPGRARLGAPAAGGDRANRRASKANNLDDCALPPLRWKLEPAEFLEALGLGADRPMSRCGCLCGRAWHAHGEGGLAHWSSRAPVSVAQPIVVLTRG